MGKHHDSKDDGIWVRIKRFFSVGRYNSYLAQHGYYDSFNEHRYSRTPGAFPHLPYSLQDMLSAKRIDGVTVLVAAHYSTARWFLHGKNTVILARQLRDTNGGSSRIRYVDSYRNYNGDKVDILVWDSHHIPPDWEEFIAKNLSPRGVVIFSYSQYFDELEKGLAGLCDHLVKKGMRSLEFRNPGPRREIMTAELYYPRDNVLDI